MKINRLFEIVYILLDKQVVTAAELAEHFEVSTRTIYRDIECLSESGIPVYMSQGKGGGISLLPDFVLNKAVITEDEKADILASLKAVNAVNLSKTDSALGKLSSMLGGTRADWIEVDFSSWGGGEKEIEIFNEVKSAILSYRLMSFSYASARGERVPRVVEPLKLCFKGSSWYLYAYCRLRCDYRFFKLRRINDLITLEEHFKRTVPEKIFTETYNQSVNLINLKLRFTSKAAYRVYEEYEDYDEQEDGSFIVNVKVPDGLWLTSYLCTYGRECEVLEPLELRNKMIDELNSMVHNYK